MKLTKWPTQIVSLFATFKTCGVYLYFIGYKTLTQPVIRLPPGHANAHYSRLMNTICAATWLHPPCRPSSSSLTATTNPWPTTRFVQNYAVFSPPQAQTPPDTALLLSVVEVLLMRSWSIAGPISLEGDWSSDAALFYVADVMQWPSSWLRLGHSTSLKYSSCHFQLLCIHFFCLQAVGGTHLYRDAASVAPSRCCLAKSGKQYWKVTWDIVSSVVLYFYRVNLRVEARVVLYQQQWYNLCKLVNH